MADKSPDYTVERRRLTLQLAEHEDTIEKGKARLQEIDRAKNRNLDRAELANLELDSEARKIEANEAALLRKMEEITTNLDAMVKEENDG